MQFKNFLKQQILRENSGLAPAPMPEEPVLMEPDSGADEMDNIPNVDIFELYPDLVNVDITCPCTLSDFFASLCELKMSSDEQAEREEMVPSLADMDSEEEFA